MKTFPAKFTFGISTAAAQIETAFGHDWQGVKARDGYIFGRTTDHELHFKEDADGWYMGLGRVSVPYLGGAVFTVKSDRIFIDADRNVTAGRIDFVTKGVAAMMEEQLAAQQNRERVRKQRENREAWKEVTFYEKVFKYDIPITSAVVGDNDVIVLYDPHNTQHLNYEVAAVLQDHPGKAVVIEDKNGEQWVVQKDKDTGKTTVTRVEGGGLGPAANIELAKEDEHVLRKALRELNREYSNKLNTYTRQTDIVTYGTAVAIVYFSDETRNKEGYKLIASGLQVKGEKVLDYLAKAREQKLTEETQVNEVMVALVEVVGKAMAATYAALDEIERDITARIGDERSLIHGRGGPRADEDIHPLPTCFDERDLAIIRDYISLSKITKSKTADGFLANTLSGLAGLIVIYNPNVVVSSALCPIIYKSATEYYIQARLEDEGFAQAGKTLTGCALEGFNRALETTGTIELKAYTALLQTGLCLTAQDQCAGKDYWTQFGYGATNALLQELDVAVMVDGVLVIIGTQLKNRFECVKKGGFVYLVVTASTVEEAVHTASKCLLGVDMTVAEWKELYGTINTYISKNWNSPYLHGQATIFIASLAIPVTKLSAAAKAIKLRLLNKLKGNPTFTNKVDDLSKISKAADEGGDVGKVVDDLAKGVGKTLTVKPSWPPNRTIVGNLDNPKGLIGVYEKTLPDGSIVNDTKRVIEELNYPETFASNFETASKDGFKMLNTNEWYYRMDEPGYWDGFNKPWLDNLTSKKADVVVLSDKSNEYLKYVFNKTDGSFVIENGQRIKTNFGKEIDYMENLVQQGKYQWDGVNGVYKYVGN